LASLKYRFLAQESLLTSLRMAISRPFPGRRRGRHRKAVLPSGVFPLARREFRLQAIHRHADGVALVGQCVFHLHIVLLRAEDDADGWVVAGGALLVVEQVQVKVHLARVLRFERTHLPFERHQGFEETGIEKEVDEILLLAEGDAVLAADEAETVAQFKDEIPQPFDKPVFQFALPDFTADTEKFEVVGALKRFFCLLGKVFPQRSGEIVRLFLRHRPLIRPCFDLVEEDLTGDNKSGRRSR
jgi:hypothetical protein